MSVQDTFHVFVVLVLVFNEGSNLKWRQVVIFQ